MKQRYKHMRKTYLRSQRWSEPENEGWELAGVGYDGPYCIYYWKRPVEVKHD